MTTTYSEAMLEALFRTRVRLAGGLAFKVAPTTKGMPDRLALFPGGRIYLVELKTDKGTLSPAQRVWHERAAHVGVRIHTLYGREQIIQWVADRMRDYDPPSREPEDPVRPATAYRRWDPMELEAIIDPHRPDDKTLAAQLHRSVPSIQAKRREMRTAPRLP